MYVPNVMDIHSIVVEIFQTKPHGGPAEKVRGSPKSVGFILWELCTSVQNVNPSNTYFSLDQSVWPIDLGIPRAMSLAWLK